MSAIRGIILPKQTLFDRYLIQGNGGEQKTLKNLARINLFVGANNSGKSRFMRALAQLKKLEFIPEGASEAWQNHSKFLIEQLGQYYKQANVTQILGPKKTIPDLSDIPELQIA